MIDVQLQGPPVGSQGRFHPPLLMDLPPPAGIILLAFAGEQRLLPPYQDPATKKAYLEKGEIKSNFDTCKIMQSHRLLVGCDERTLNEELVLAFRVRWRFFFEGLEHNLEQQKGVEYDG